MGTSLDGRALPGEPTSELAAQLLTSSGINLNKLLLPLMQEGDHDGTFATAFLHELLYAQS